MDTSQETETVASGMNAARTLHPEDISVGDDVALSEISGQFPSFLWCGADPVMLPPDRKVQVTFFPWETLDLFKVKSICLPFVLCKHLDGSHEIFDIRQVRFARLDPTFATLARKAIRSSEKSKRCACKSNKKRRKRKKRNSK